MTKHERKAAAIQDLSLIAGRFEAGSAWLAADVARARQAWEPLRKMADLSTRAGRLLAELAALAPGDAEAAELAARLELARADAVAAGVTAALRDDLAQVCERWERVCAWFAASPARAAADRPFASLAEVAACWCDLMEAWQALAPDDPAIEAAAARFASAEPDAAPLAAAA